MSSVIHISAAETRGVLLDNTGQIWNSATFVAFPSAGLYPGNTLISPTRLGNSQHWAYTIPAAVDLAEWTLHVYGTLTPDTSDLIVSSATKGILFDSKGHVAVRTDGSTLTVQTGSTTTILVVIAESGILTELLDDALITVNTPSRIKCSTRVINVSGTAPNFTLTVSPALPETPQNNDTFILGPKYLDSGTL